MSENAIQESIAAFGDAVRRDDENAALAVGLQLLARALVDLNRTANALEVLAGRGPINLPRG